MCAALRREPNFENEPPSIPVTVGNFKLQDHKLRGSLKRNARPALKPCLVVRQGGVIYKEEGGVSGVSGMGTQCPAPSYLWRHLIRRWLATAAGNLADGERLEDLVSLRDLLWGPRVAGVETLLNSGKILSAFP